LSERIYKLQPDRTIQLRGFSDLGASAAIHSATAEGFTVSGVFRDAADFAVLVLYDADNFYEHPRLKYLPDTDFSGLTLTFDVRYSGLMPLDSPKYPTIDWPFLDVIRPDGTTAKIRLFEHAVQVSGDYTCASASFVIEDNGLQPYDRVTLWYQNFAFDYIVPDQSGPLPTAAEVAAALAAQINAVNWEALGILFPLAAQADGATLHIQTTRPGADGNMLRMYAVAKNARLRASNPVAIFQGGSSDATWRVTLDFSALGIPQIRQMWLTFAPPLADGQPFQDTEWQAAFTNWSLSGPEEKRALAVAGPGSVRVEEDDEMCRYEGQWSVETGWYSGGFARRASAIGDAVTIFYCCAQTHDLYLGTSLYSDRARIRVQLDEDEPTELDCRLNTEPAVVTRRKLRSGVAPGEHTVTLRLVSEGYFYFDFLEAAVPSDLPDPLPALERVAPALDYSTDHTYKLPPARILWMLEQLGYHGPLNEYIGVFWWNQRRREGATIPQAQIAFTGQFVPGDQVFVNIGGQVCGKSVFPNEDASIIARHFAFFINMTYVGVWAAAQDNVLTITARAAHPAYSFPVQSWVERASGSTGEAALSGSLQGGDPGRWVVDPAQTPVLNRGARDWHADLFRECARRGRELTVAASLELVNPPAEFAARYPDGQTVETAVGFGSLVSTHCSFSTPMLGYHKALFAELALRMTEAGLTPRVQLGEFCWWYFTNYSSDNPDGGMAYYDAETMAQAENALGRPLYIFRSSDDDPEVNQAADAAFLRNRLRDYVAALAAHIRQSCPAAQMEILFPYDVNYPEPKGVHQIGGRLNRFVNLPPEWTSKNSSGLDGFKTEALDFGAWCRNLDLTGEAIQFATGLDWPKDSLRHLVAIFQPGYAWEKECREALGRGLHSVVLWAFDHVCLFNLNPRLESLKGKAQQF